MYEQMTYDYILQRMLDAVPAVYNGQTVDKREGSLIWTACSAVAAEEAQFYMDLSINWNQSFADTATGDALSRRAAEYGVNREEATKALRRGVFYGQNNAPMDIPLNSRFSLEAVNFVAVERINLGEYRLQCEQPGTIGNTASGQLLPIDYIDGLVSAELLDVLVPGEDEETDDQLRARYFEAMNEPAFGGNIADYKRKVNAIDGVGATKVFPTWQGGGTVKCVIIASDWNEPSQALVDEVQTIVDPTVNQGKGLGTAPIGHTVTIAGVEGEAINISTTLTLAAGTTIAQVQQTIEAAIETYLLGLRKNWVDTPGIIVREALIESAILSVPGVVDVTNTTLNGVAANVALTEEQIPVLGAVTLNE